MSEPERAGGGRLTVGRDQELRAIAELGLALTEGSGGACVFVGDAGIGKTHLLGVAAETARAAGIAVAAGSVEELERGRPFGVLADAFDVTLAAPDPPRRRVAELIRHHVTPTPSPGLGFAPEPRFHVQEAFVALVEHLLADGPLLLALDDLHWADTSTISTVLALWRRHRTDPFGLVLGLRPTPTSPELDRLLDQLERAGAGLVDLRPLSRSAVTSLAEMTLGAAPARHVEARLAEAAGNPFYVIELLRADDEGSAPGSDGFRRRLRLRSGGALDVVRAGAIFGSTFEVAEVAELTGLDEATCRRHVVSAIDAALIDGSGERLRFSHELIRRAIYDDIPAAVRRSLHRAAGHLLADRSADLVRIAAQFSAGAVAPDPEAASWLARAGAAVTDTEPSAAAALLERALDLLPPDDERRAAIRCDLLEALTWCGRLADTQELATAELRTPPDDPDLVVRLRRALGLSFFLRGRGREAAETWEVGLTGGEVGSVESRRIRAEAASARVWATDIAEAEAHVEALLADEAALDPITAVMSLSVRSRILAVRGHTAAAIEAGERSVALARSHPDAERRAPHSYLALAYLQADRLDDALQVTGAGHRAGERLGTPDMLGVLDGTAIVCHFFGGNWDNALTEASVEAEQAELRHGSLLGTQSRSMRAIIGFHRGEVDEATTLAAEQWALLADGASPVGLQFLVWLEGLLAEHRGDADQARFWFGTALDEFVRVGAIGLLPSYASDMTRVFHHHAPARLGPLVEALSAAATLGPSALSQGTLGLAVAHRDLDAGAAARAAALLARSSRPMEALNAHVMAADLELRTTADRAAVTEQLRRALDLADRLGATLHQQRVAARLAEVGVRVPAARRARPSTGWEALTPTERTVADLVADGLSNPQIAERLYVSRRTVETHVSHVLTKLGLTGRTALAGRPDPATPPGS